MRIMRQEIIDRAVYFMTDIYSKIIIKIVVALIIILIGFVLARFIGRLVYKVLNELDINSYFRKATGINISPDSVIAKSIDYLLDFFIIIIALDAIAFTPGIIYILSAAVVTIILVSIIIGIKDLIPNVVAGLVLYKKKLYTVGDIVEISGHKGKIERIELLETIIKKKDKNVLYMPNSEFLKTNVLKRTQED